MTIAEEIKKEMKKQGIKQADLVRLSGVPQGRISQILSGKTPNPTGETLDKIRKALGENSLGKEDFIRVPLYGQASGSGVAGNWAVNREGKVQDYLAFDRAFARVTFGTTSNLACLRATGDSMLPTITQGDLLVIDVSDCTLLMDAAPYILQIGETTTVKRIHRMSRAVIRIASDNPTGWAKEISLADLEAEGIEIKGRVVAVMKMA